MPGQASDVCAVKSWVCTQVFSPPVNRLSPADTFDLNASFSSAGTVATHSVPAMARRRKPSSRMLMDAMPESPAASVRSYGEIVYSGCAECPHVVFGASGRVVHISSSAVHTLSIASQVYALFVWVCGRMCPGGTGPASDVSKFLVPSLLLLRDSVERPPPFLHPITSISTDGHGTVVTSYAGVTSTSDTAR